MLSVSVLSPLYSAHWDDEGEDRYIEYNNRQSRLAAVKNIFSHNPQHRLLGKDYKQALDDLFSTEGWAYKQEICNLIKNIIKASDSSLTEVRAYNTYFLKVAVLWRNLPLVELLLKLGTDCNVLYEKRQSPLDLAVGNKNLALVGCLLAYGAIIPEHLAGDKCIIEAQKIQNMVIKAVRSDDTVTLSNLLKKDIYINNEVKEYMYQKLIKAIEQDSIEDLRFLIRGGFSLSVCDKIGNTLLHTALQLGSVKCVQYLVAFLHIKYRAINSFLNKVNKVGLTPIGIAVNSPKMLQLLLGLQADLPEIDLAIPAKSRCTIS